MKRLVEILERCGIVMVLGILALSAASCSYIFEDSEECDCIMQESHKMELRFNIDFKDIPLTFVARGGDEDKHLRCSVLAYDVSKVANEDLLVLATPDLSYQFMLDSAEGTQNVLISLTKGHWKLMVWVDYYDTNESYAYYTCEDFSEITVNNIPTYRGCDDYRDCFRGSGYVDITDVDIANGQNGLIKDVIIDMERPLAKYRVITTDLSAFINAQQEDIAKRSSQSNATQKPTVNLSDYTVRFYYTGFMPSAYNMFYDKPSNAITGAYFDGQITKISDTEAEIGSDYVFIGNSETSVALAVAIYNSDGDCVSMSQSYNVPIQRNTITLVSGEFLTATNGRAAVINTEYEGEYNIKY